MKNKKGFTLVELLVSIVLIITISALAIISYKKITEARKEDQYIAMQNQIEAATEQYLISHSYIINDMDKAEVYIPIKTLVNHEYLKVLINPITNTKLDDNSIVKINKDNNDIKISYDENFKAEILDDSNYVVFNTTRYDNSVVNKELEAFYTDENNNGVYVTEETIKKDKNDLFVEESFRGINENLGLDKELMIAYCADYNVENVDLSKVDESKYDELLKMDDSEEIFVDYEKGKKNRICALFSKDIEVKERIAYINNNQIINSITFGKKTK